MGADHFHPSLAAAIPRQKRRDPRPCVSENQKKSATTIASSLEAMNHANTPLGILLMGPDPNYMASKLAAISINDDRLGLRPSSHGGWQRVHAAMQICHMPRANHA